MYLVCMYLQFHPSGKDIRDKTYEQVANIFANVAPLQKISIDFMRNVPVNLKSGGQNPSILMESSFTAL